MRVIGARELKQSLSATLRAVGRGEHVRVTLRGRAVADIVPAGAATGDEALRRLVADGRLVLPTRGLPDKGPRLVTSARSASEFVLAEREAGR
jgi:antitoxin (DNA-binding transcriptional repressor) of toxin-antitoxin stability system